MGLKPNSLRPIFLQCFDAVDRLGHLMLGKTDTFTCFDTAYNIYFAGYCNLKRLQVLKFKTSGPRRQSERVSAVSGPRSQ